MDGELIKLLAKDLDVSAVSAHLLASPDLWKENTWRQDYVVQYDRPISPQQDTEAVMFRWAPENTIESVRDSLEVRVHPNLHNIKEIQPLIEACLDACRAIEVGRIFVAKLKPGGKVIPHCDYGTYADHFERFHLVLSSSPGNEFFVQNELTGYTESTYMQPGEFYWFNHKEIHWAVNGSDSPRMHLIMDAVAPEYRRERNA